LNFVSQLRKKMFPDSLSLAQDIIRNIITPVIYAAFTFVPAIFYLCHLFLLIKLLFRLQY